jgi:prepilin-type N-terminal cleavage/methylation domain-containing protein/prepilin-type processing-associated H-X9-DG protein
MKRAEKAFTLVELLVVISIIALLLAVLMPALAKVKEQGRTIICGTNLKNYGLAVGMYANSNSNSFPDQYFLYTEATLNMSMKGNKSGFVPRQCRWHYSEVPPDGSLWPYLKDKNVHMCPTFRNFAKSGGHLICPNSDEHGATLIQTYNPMFSYSINAVLADWRHDVAMVKVSDVKRPSQCMAFSEENLWSINQLASATCTIKKHLIRRSLDGNLVYSNAILNDNLLDIEYTRGVSDNIATYHKVSTAKSDYGYANCVFVDGHVAVTAGKAGAKAYLEYGKPSDGYVW